MRDDDKPRPPESDWRWEKDFIAREERHEHVAHAQEFLVSFGYLDARLREPGVLDAATFEALLAYQRRVGLPPTGELTRQTLSEMSKPRCGEPDRHATSSWMALMKSWSPLLKRNLTFRFVNGTASMPNDDERVPVRNAFATWAAASGLTFTEVPSAPADFDVQWVAGAHGTHVAFDGVPSTGTNVLGHAFKPRPAGGTSAGQVCFDDGDAWSAHGGPNMDLEGTALHEIGHLLGLDHSDDSSTVMASVSLVALQPEDLARVRRVYALGRLWHSIRHFNPWTPFADVEDAAGERGRFIEVASAAMGDDLHVCGITDDGKLWHSIRKGSPWTPFTDVEPFAGAPGFFAKVSCAVMGEELHVCAITDDGRLWHCIRKGNPWTQFADVEPHAGARGPFVSVGCAVMGSDLHVCAVTEQGRLFHTIRKGNPWDPWTDLGAEAGTHPGRINSVTITAVNDQLHVFATTIAGRVWRTFRYGPWGYWTRFEEVTGPDAAGDPRTPFVVHSAAATIQTSPSTWDLHLCIVLHDGGMLHAINFTKPGHLGLYWTKFADVKAEAGNRGDVGKTACTGLASRLHVLAITVEGPAPFCDC